MKNQNNTSCPACGCQIYDSFTGKILMHDTANCKCKWTVSEVACDVCTHEWTAIRPVEAEHLECPNCGNMNQI